MISSLFIPYGRGLGQAVREAERLAASCPHDLSLRSRETISVTLSRLKKKGLVTSKGPPRKTLWKITARGKYHFRATKNAGGPALPPKDGRARIVIFDIPEDERGKRGWLRKRLLACDYAPLQKSVWVGERPLPQELLQELKDLHISRYVHVLGLEDKSRY